MGDIILCVVIVLITIFVVHNNFMLKLVHWDYFTGLIWV